MVHHVIQYFHVFNGGILIGPSAFQSSLYHRGNQSKTPQADIKAVNPSDKVLLLTMKKCFNPQTVG